MARDGGPVRAEDGLAQAGSARALARDHRRVLAAHPALPRTCPGRRAAASTRGGASSLGEAGQARPGLAREPEPRSPQPVEATCPSLGSLRRWTDRTMSIVGLTAKSSEPTRKSQSAARDSEEKKKKPLPTTKQEAAPKSTPVRTTW